MFSAVLHRFSSRGSDGLTFYNEKKWLVLTCPVRGNLFVFSNDRQQTRSSTDFTLDIPFFPLSEPNQIQKYRLKTAINIFIVASFCCSRELLILTRDQILEEERQSDWFIVYIGDKFQEWQFHHDHK